MTRFQDLLRQKTEAETAMHIEFDILWIGLRGGREGIKRIPISRNTIVKYKYKDACADVHLEFEWEPIAAHVHCHMKGGFRDGSKNVIIDGPVFKFFELLNTRDYAMEMTVCSTKEAIDAWLAEPPACIHPKQ